MTFDVPAHAVDVIVADTRTWGKRNVETGGFLLAPRSQPEVVTHVALAGEVGIERHAMRYVVSGSALDVLFEYAEEHDLAVVAQHHSHRMDAFLSPIDRTGGLCVPDFVSAVVPDFASPPKYLSEWGWWVYCDRWEPVEPPSMVGGSVELITFDGAGIE